MKGWLKNRISKIGCPGGMKALSCLAVCLTIAMSCPVSAQAGWVETPEWRYVEEDGTLRKGDWYEDELGAVYYLDENGCLATGFDDTGNEDIRFFDPSGVLAKGLIEVDGAVYFLDDQGKLESTGIFCADFWYRSAFSLPLFWKKESVEGAFHIYRRAVLQYAAVSPLFLERA